jgi:multisubunit Na+/H+ antiporter MnhE subunit
LVVYGLVFGAIVGALVGLIFHALQGGRRDFASVRVMAPSRYEVVVDAEVADEAARMLAGMKAGSTPGSSSTPGSGGPGGTPAGSGALGTDRSAEPAGGSV